MKRFSGGQQPLKVAILFSGRIKGYERVLPKLQDIKNRYSPTYYCSLNEPEYNEYIDTFCKLFDISRERINTEVTPHPEFLKNVKNYKSNSPRNTYSMFYHENKAFAMMGRDVVQNNKDFDCIMYYRADMNSPDMLNLEMPKPNTIYIPNGHDYGGINDRLAYGNFESMKQYCNLIDTLDSAEIMNGNTPEGILKGYLDKQKVEIVRFKFDTCLIKERNNKNDMPCK
jgi:hypothetical protein